MFFFHHCELNEERFALMADVILDGQQHRLHAQPVEQPLIADQNRIPVQQQLRVEEHSWLPSEEGTELQHRENLLSQQIQAGSDLDRAQECAGTPVEESLLEDTSALFVRTQSDISPVIAEADRHSVLLDVHQSMGDSISNVGSLVQCDRRDLRERRFMPGQDL